jgi:carbon storage regulator
MLLITRREGEGIVINGSIEVRILEIRGGRVKLGFEYPVGNTVFRQELFAKIQAENQAAAQTLAPLGQMGPDQLQAALRQIGTMGARAEGTHKKDSPDANHDHDDHNERTHDE